MKMRNREKNTGKFRIFLAAIIIISAIAVPGASAEAAGEKMLVPMGNTMGIQMYTDGVMVVGLSTTENGEAPSPAAQAGVLPGDLIIGLGADKISSAEDFRKAAEKIDGDTVSITVKRGNETLQFNLALNPETNAPEMGIWLRDFISGIGTMTFYDPETGKYGGLGHSINDVDSGALLPLGRGDILKSSVSGIVRGSAGAPGELCGTFDPNGICGNIMKNTSCGIFGELKTGVPSSDKAIPMGSENDITLGKAKIYANIRGTDIKEYEIEVVRVYRNDLSGRSMMIKVTDSELLEMTGGIVQGMSGSPIIQNGKLIGAVTHVMINDPTSGFGVSAEKMIEYCELDAVS